MPTTSGFRVPWLPGSQLLMWPFGWWLVVVVDHFSREVLAIEAFRSLPSAAELWRVLDSCVAGRGPPKHIVTDQGLQFHGDYRTCCQRHGIKPRYRAIGKHGSIALVERFILSLKTEAFIGDLVPMGDVAMRSRLDAYRRWFNEHRPHRSLGGSTPAEVVAAARDNNVLPANQRPRHEPRRRYPAMARNARPQATVQTDSHGAPLALDIDHVPGTHLPIISVRRAA